MPAIRLRFGPKRLAHDAGVPARRISHVLNRHHVPPSAWLDPVAGTVIRASRSTANRCEREKPGELVHIDVKKLGRIPDGGGWRADPDQSARNHRTSHRKIGFEYVHAAVDDHTRLAYAEIHPDEKGATAAGFHTRAATYFAQHGTTRMERVISDKAFAYRNSAAFKKAVTDLGAVQKFIRPHCPWQNGKVERFNRTLANEWACRQPLTSNRFRPKLTSLRWRGI